MNADQKSDPAGSLTRSSRSSPCRNCNCTWVTALVELDSAVRNRARSTCAATTEAMFWFCAEIVSTAGFTDR